MPSDLLEAVAAQGHVQWSGWAKFLLQDVKGTVLRGVVSILRPWDEVDRWRKQMDTPYADLSEEDKEKDRVFARKMLAEVGRRMTRAASSGMVTHHASTGETTRKVRILISEDDYDAIMAAVEKEDGD
jgi:hypothetical protein